MKVVIAALALSLVVVGGARAQTARWTPSSVNDNFIRGVDLNSIRPKGSLRAFQALSVYRGRHDFAGHQVDYMVMGFEIDCAASTVRTLNLHGYLADGSSVFASKLNGDAEPIVAESMSAGEQNTVCEGPASDIRHATVPDFVRWGRATGIADWNG